ncbi:MAG: replication-associated recombination protein A [Candidatus Aerophobetes bacterium]|nr:replication-associated recombination protein A [Candidatus Aerophobetes bacterium]
MKRELFHFNQEKSVRKQAPLADRIRPTSLDEFVGQEDIVGKGKILRKMMEEDKLASLLFWGPPGSGKTTLARIIAHFTKSHFIRFSAVTSGIAEVRKVVKEARVRLEMYGQRTILFIDEIHRFNKAQQDAFLPHIEDGTITLIGATTENPSFEIIGPLLSRTRIFTLERLNPQEIKKILTRAMKDKRRGLGEYKIEVEPETLNLIIEGSNGDARIALNILEIATNVTRPGREGIRSINLKTVKEVFQSRTLLYDKKGEEHYNVISAFIKSMRGSNPDAALYWLARMIEAGEDPRFIARRLVILASEDIGNADPQALSVAVAAARAVDFVGMPEAQINLAQAATYLASAPKSNASYKGLLEAKEDVRKNLNLPVPLHLRNAPTTLMKELGYGKNYKYPHNFPQGKVDQKYLPEGLEKKKYYKP